MTYTAQKETERRKDWTDDALENAKLVSPSINCD